MPNFEEEIEKRLVNHLSSQSRRAAETSDNSPETKELAYAILAVSNAIKAGAILESDSYEALKHYHKHRRLPESVAPFAVPVPAHVLDPEAKKILLKVTGELQKLPIRSQILAATELYRQWPGISGVASEASGRNSLAIAKQLLGIAGHPIPSNPEYFESLVYGYFYDLDPESGRVTFLTETIWLRFNEIESSSEGCMVLRGEGKHPTPNGEVISKLRAERITESAFQLTARFPSGSGFTSSFTRSVKGVLLGAWAGGSNHKGRDIFSPMCLSAERFEDEASLMDYIGEALPKDKELGG